MLPKYKAILAILTLSIVTGCGAAAMDVAAVPAPAMSIPAVEAPAVGVYPALPFTVPLPGLHDPVVPRDHAVERHGEGAYKARRIIEDPNSNCQYFQCDGPSGPGTSVLRQCVEPSSSTYALQYIWYNEKTGKWAEGTAFTQARDKALDYRTSKNCVATGDKPFTYNDHPSLMLDWLKQEEL